MGDFSEIDIISIRYATLHSWGLALVRYIRLKLNILSIPNINYCKMVVCYWLVLSTYYVDFLKYFTFFNKLFNKSLWIIYTSKKESIFSISLRCRHKGSIILDFQAIFRVHFHNTGHTPPINTMLSLKTLKCFVIFKRQK